MLSRITFETRWERSSEWAKVQSKYDVCLISLELHNISHSLFMVSRVWSSHQATCSVSPIPMLSHVCLPCARFSASKSHKQKKTFSFVFYLSFWHFFFVFIVRAFCLCAVSLLWPSRLAYLKCTRAVIAQNGFRPKWQYLLDWISAITIMHRAYPMTSQTHALAHKSKRKSRSEFIICIVQLFKRPER